MAVKVLERFIQGKISEEACEDAIFMSDDFIAVIDGVTSKSDFLYEKKTTGKLAAQITASVLGKLRQDAAWDEFIAQVNQKIQSFYQQVEFPYSQEEKGLQAVCAVYSVYRREIWLIGDCQVRIDGELYLNPKRSDDILAEMRCLMMNIERADKQRKFSEEEAQQKARCLIEPWILRSTIFANDSRTPYGYSILNGEPIPESLIKIIHLDHSPHDVILTSDGYPKVCANLEESEAYLKKVLESDKSCSEIYHSTKGVKEGYRSFDDRSYIRFRV